MAGLLELCKVLEQTAVAARIRESLWLFPILESLHLLGMAALLATIGAFDLRLLDFALSRVPITNFAARIFPWVWAAFAIQVLTGFLLFSSEATRMYPNPAFRFKMALIALAGLNALVFRLMIFRSSPGWNPHRTPPAARFSGALSLLLWIGVIIAGRLIGFV